MKDSVEEQTQIPIACSLTEDELVDRSGEFDELFAAAQEIQETTSGYALSYPLSGGWPEKVLDLVIREHACCPFFEFKLVIEPGDSPLWLHIGGSAEAKKVVEEGLSLRGIAG
jgi:hypothetical protein